MYHVTAENLKKCVLFSAWKAKMHNLETEDCLLQILLSFVILSKFR